MGKKEAKPWSFGFFGGKSGGKSVILFILVLVCAVLTHIGGAIYGEIKDRRERPSLALKSILRDVREYVRLEKQMPQNWREIEVKIWHAGTPAPTRVLAGNVLVVGNYEYFLRAGTVRDINLINIWALPLGKYRDEYETVLLLISPEGEEVWRGPALSDAQRALILKDGFNPTFAQMSQLNMKKEAPPTAPPKGGLGLF